MTTDTDYIAQYNTTTRRFFRAFRWVMYVIAISGLFYFGAPGGLLFVLGAMLWQWLTFSAFSCPKCGSTVAIYRKGEKGFLSQMGYWTVLGEMGWDGLCWNCKTFLKRR